MLRPPAITVLFACLLLAACTTERLAAPTSTRTSSAAATPSASSASSVAAGAIEGSFDVGGHSLYLNCQGTGSPTVVYLHGYIFDQFGGGSINAGEIPGLLSDTNRICVYDRANVQSSDSIEGRQTGADAVRDLHRLLTAAEVPGPYLLLGASYGGLISYLFTVKYPTEVLGLVLLDPALPGDIDIERRFIEPDLVTGPDDWKNTVEHLDQYATAEQAQALGTPQFDIPLTLIATEVLELDSTWPPDTTKAITSAFRKMQRAFLSQFSPGRLIIVDTPHYMEPVIPDRIAAEVRRVLQEVGS